MRITSKGQVTIPQAIREQAGLLPHTEVDFVYDGKTVQIVRVDGSKSSRGARIVEHLRGRLAGKGLTTDQLMALTRR
ncbi:AbrB/MazE/SpoVT family DNA-binding domain-containing protein [Reyranella sp.]|uniref:AbrB/MazE/SpoVT family DNA-binding domain-containing protein n=1 Tax=Reyranella sp. TaxID=1929291 RepID=UPI003D0E02B9